MVVAKTKQDTEKYLKKSFDFGNNRMKTEGIFFYKFQILY